LVFLETLKEDVNVAILEIGALIIALVQAYRVRTHATIRTTPTPAENSRTG
jgi:hypothetical protein